MAETLHNTVQETVPDFDQEEGIGTLLAALQMHNFGWGLPQPSTTGVDPYLAKVQASEKLVDKIWSDDLKNLPSSEDEDYKSIRREMMTGTARKAYIKKIGYVLLSREFISDLSKELKARKIEDFIELQAGTGALTRVMLQNDFTGFGRTLEIPDKDIDPDANHWGLDRSEIYNRALDDDILYLGDIREACDTTPDLIISSWIPYEGGSEVQKYFEHSGYPLWYLVIGEGRGGCTASDSYFDWLESNYTLDTTIESMDSFSAIYDRAELYKRKEK